MHKAVFCAQSPAEMTTTVIMMKMQKDAELDKKIEALRKKNEALMKRYQEVEEDKKRAEQEGMTLHGRKGKPNDLTITLDKSFNEQRVVTKKCLQKGSHITPDQEKNLCKSGSRPGLSVGRGKRRQLLVTMPGNMKTQKVFGERKDRNRPVSPSRVKPSAEEEQAVPDSSARVKRHPSTKRIVEMKEETGTQDVQSRCEECGQASEGDTDLNLMCREEQTEYRRWKKEREEIDRERVARHKNSKGQWRRAWDVEKPSMMLSDKPDEGPDRDTHNTGNRNGRSRNLRMEESRAREKKGKSVPVVSSKAKGKERLTGRARRWDAKEDEGHVEVYPEEGLQAFLEELDALCSSEEKNLSPKKQDAVPNSKPHVSEVPFKPKKASSDTQNGRISTEMPNCEMSGLKATEKKVRFSEELLEMAHEISDSIIRETAAGSQVQNTSHEKQTISVDCLEDKILTGAQKKCLLEEEKNVMFNDKASCLSMRSVCISEEPVQTQPVEITKSCCEEVMDTSLRVLNLDSCESLSDCSATDDMEREKRFRWKI